MRIVITTTDNATTFMRRAGYGYQKEGAGEVAFVRRVSGSSFPRYHAYVTEGRGKREEGRGGDGAGGLTLIINLHVDQKAPTYQQGRAHSGEYDGQLVEQEATRLRALASEPPPAAPKPPKPKKGFFGKLFG
ncbi:hypothetical protein HY635_02755 [Candidatus Uhrbacteria bacterium]|nr:hypothetical protein [Candidatus Uhrbacteria bacterium]